MWCPSSLSTALRLQRQKRLASSSVTMPRGCYGAPISMKMLFPHSGGHCSEHLSKQGSIATSLIFRSAVSLEGRGRIKTRIHFVFVSMAIQLTWSHFLTKKLFCSYIKVHIWSQPREHGESCKTTYNQ